MMGVRPRVYLAGPMTGLTGFEMDSWRSLMEVGLGQPFVCLRPTRDKPFLHNGDTKLGPDTYKQTSCYWAKPAHFAARDEHDVRNADAVVMNLLGAERPESIGTMMEAGMARALGIPLVVIMEQDSPYNRSLLPEWATFVVRFPYQAADVVRSLFGK